MIRFTLSNEQYTYRGSLPTLPEAMKYLEELLGHDPFEDLEDESVDVVVVHEDGWRWSAEVVP